MVTTLTLTHRENVRCVQRYFRGNLEATAPEEEGREVQHLGPEVTSDVMLLGIKIMRKLLRVTLRRGGGVSSGSYHCLEQQQHC